MKAFYALVIPLLLIVSSINAYSQSNKGTEFWTCYMDHTSGANGSSMILYITSDLSTTGNVTIADGTFSQPFTVTANAVTFVTIPASAFLGTGGQFLKGIHITSAKPIAVYAHIYASSVSGATLLLPVNAMGKDYLSLNYTQRSNDANSKSIFNVIGTEDNTTVSITPIAALTDGSPAGVAFQIQLNKGQVYQGLSTLDLTGTKIQSISNASGACKKIAVFSGSSKISIGCTVGSSDNLFQQVYPTSTWGKNYVSAPLKNRPYDVYRIVLSTTNTNVTLDGMALNASQFTNGLYYEFNSTSTKVISADKPIQVVQYSATQGENINCGTTNGDVGDPEMIYLSPIEQGLDHVTLYSTGYYKILASYINVVIPTTAVSSFTLDGVAYTNFTPVTSNTAYSYAQIPVSSGPQAGGGGSVTSGTHTIKASAPFNAIAYGFGSTESYGYAAGTNLQDLNQYVAVQNPKDTTAALTAGCSNMAYKVQVAIPYQTTNITWQTDGVITYTDAAPTYRSTIIKNGVTLYVYENPKPATFTAGTHTVVATVFDPVADVCGSNVDIENNFTITDPATSNFTVGASNCLGDLTTFVDSTTLATGNREKSWLWDFGDNTTSTLQNPTYTYAKAGNFSVHLTVTDINGCSSVSAAKSVHIIGKPVASFTTSAPDCPGQNVTFTNTSTTAEGNITKWSWDFGDGTTSDVATAVPLAHNYSTAGTYTVKLIITTDLGCVSDPLQSTIIINPLPVADFTLPDVCLSDAFATFTNTSTIADHTESGFTYLWDFGDGNSNAANNKSTLKNPLHKYSQVGVYHVKQTVTSANGCTSVTTTHDFTVNGSTPKAAFVAENNCSSDDIIFDDQSTVVEFGNATKIVWYFDYNGNPGASETFTSTTMHADKKYTHHYPTFSSPATQTYNVRLDTYSGGSCVNTIYKSITINANPTITLTANGTSVGATLTLCQADGTIQIVENKNGFVGTGIFSGTGISAAGSFDPKISGTGAFAVNYIFTATGTGCTYSTSFVINVNATPTVTLPDAYTVLEGGELTLVPVAAIASGTMTYKWTPSAGLSNASIANPVANPTVDTKYTLTVTSDKGCAVAAQTTVTVLKSPLVPNTFTPNNDGINDTWDIKYLNSYPHCTVEVINRYGEKVYYSVGYPIPWNGQYKGADLPVGTYYYIINPNSGRKPLSGSIAIIR